MPTVACACRRILGSSHLLGSLSTQAQPRAVPGRLVVASQHGDQGCSSTNGEKWALSEPEAQYGGMPPTIIHPLQALCRAEPGAWCSLVPVTCDALANLCRAWVQVRPERSDGQEQQSGLAILLSQPPQLTGSLRRRLCQWRVGAQALQAAPCGSTR